MKVPVTNDVCPCCMMDGVRASPWVLVGRGAQRPSTAGEEQEGDCDDTEISAIMG